MSRFSMFSLLPRYLGGGLLLATLWLAGGCGQKGPLYLPGDEPTVTPATESEPPETINQD